jgi:hypothetical protein
VCCFLLASQHCKLSDTLVCIRLAKLTTGRQTRAFEDALLFIPYLTPASIEDRGYAQTAT